MNRTSVLLAVFLILALSCVALAQEEEEPGDVLEIVLRGGVGLPMGGITDWQTGADLSGPENIVDRAPKTGWDIGLDIGYFLNPKLIVGFNFTYTEFSIDADLVEDHHHRLFTPSIYGKYYFEGETNLVPYIKANVGLENAKFSSFVENPDGRNYRELSYDPALTFGLGVGIFYYTADYSGVFIEANYRTAMTEDAECEYFDKSYTFGENIGVLQIDLGIRLLVGSGD
ncbi:MAG: hypothetical protein DRP47_01955 [Candidatus Zixiibacteriota bacterium]|nr:MAG: hypothetical protein DRP47_01955 [candidate division Zixibacteria bacterium]